VSAGGRTQQRKDLETDVGADRRRAVVVKGATMGWHDRRLAARGVFLAALVATLGGMLPSAASTAAASDPASSYTAPAYAEPVTLSSKDGVLEVSLFVRQGTAKLDTVTAPVSNFLLFGYELQRGTASNGERTGKNLYPGPTLQVNPGETLIVHVVNELADLTIPDFYDPAFTPAGKEVSLYPRQVTSAPFNLHTHGLHVSPRGNSDNVLLNIPPGYTNTYTYQLPPDHPEGMYWYHSHRHTLTAQQTYLGLAGLLQIGRSDGNLPAVTEHHLPVRNMSLQYNFVFDRAGGQTVLNNVNWSQWVSTLKPPEGSELADGTYHPSLAPTSFKLAKKGTEYFTVWYSGPLSIDNGRGQFQFVPQNLQTFVSDDGTRTVAAKPDLPSHLRDVQFTVNGQFEPELRAKPGQTEIWVLANVSDYAYVPVRLTETATGKHPRIAIVGQDGNPFPAVHHPVTDGGTTLAIPPGSRYAIAVTMPLEGDLVLDMPPATGLATLSRPAVLYTSDGTDRVPGVLGKVTVEPSAMSYFDGFFASPTQVLARVKPAPGKGVTVAFAEGQKLGARTSYVDLAGKKPAVERELLVSGGFNNEYASKQDPKAFLYEFANNTFPNTPLLQPRLGTVEQWSFVNHNNDEHPIHIHVNDFQVTSMVDPVRKITTGVQPWGEDNANLPAPLLGPGESLIEAGTLVLRSEFLEFTGPFVVHCHRLNHEDNGLMAMVNVIPAVSSYAVAESGAEGRDAQVRVHDGDGDRLLATVTPFPGFTGALSVTMGDVDGDQVLDLVAGKGPGDAPEVVAYSGAAGGDGKLFTRELARFAAFDPSFRGGVSVATAGIDGNPLADNVIVGSGPGMEPTVKVFGAKLPAKPGTAPEVFSTFTPYPGGKGGVSVATGLVDAVSGRWSIVTAPGAGEPAQIKTFRFDLYRPNTGAAAWCAPKNPLPIDVPRETASFVAFDGYTGGVSLATGFVAAGALGGAQSIVVAQDAAPGTVKLFSSGSALDGEPVGYLESPDQHGVGPIAFREIASFAPFDDAPKSGVRAATTSTTSGADVVVSGLDAKGTGVRVRKYGLARAFADATTLSPKLVAEVASFAGTVPSALGGD